MDRSERSERRLDAHRKITQGYLENFLGYHATGQKGLEGALRATETSCVPLQESTANRCVFLFILGKGHVLESVVQHFALFM